MEFSLECPTDGPVEIGLEDISSVVLRGPEAVDIIFACPHCGTSLRASLRVPNLLMAAMELARYSADGDGSEADETGVHLALAFDATGPADAEFADDEAVEPYCEYFRRQLARIECVEDLLAEIDADGS